MPTLHMTPDEFDSYLRTAFRQGAATARDGGYSPSAMRHTLADITTAREQAEADKPALLWVSFDPGNMYELENLCAGADTFIQASTTTEQMARILFARKFRNLARDAYNEHTAQTRRRSESTT